MALIQRNLVPGTGDRLLTLDTETNLEWLNLTATLNLSYSDILDGADDYTTKYGVRFATGTEIGLLWMHAGITKSSRSQVVPFPMHNHLAMDTLIQLMGGISLQSSVPSGEVLVQTQGMMKFQGADVPAPPVSLELAQLFLYKSSPENSYGDTNPGRSAVTRTPEIGSYLVRDRITAT